MTKPNLWGKKRRRYLVNLHEVNGEDGRLQTVPERPEASQHGNGEIRYTNTVEECDRNLSGWWFGTFLFFHILNIIIPTDFHNFLECLKPPVSFL